MKIDDFEWEATGEYSEYTQVGPYDVVLEEPDGLYSQEHGWRVEVGDMTCEEGTAASRAAAFDQAVSFIREETVKLATQLGLLPSL